MGNGGGIGMVFSLSCQRSWGSSLGIDSLTISSNILHPLATVLCPSESIVWPAATFLTATTKFTVNTFSSTSSTFYSISIINTCTNILNSSDMIDIPINIFPLCLFSLLIYPLHLLILLHLLFLLLFL